MGSRGSGAEEVGEVGLAGALGGGETHFRFNGSRPPFPDSVKVVWSCFGGAGKPQWDVRCRSVVRSMLCLMFFCIISTFVRACVLKPPCPNDPPVPPVARLSCPIGEDMGG